METEKTDGQVEHTDDLSRLQSKLEELGELFYSVLGIIQRDAPPTQRAPDEEGDALADDENKRKLLAETTPDFAGQIVKASRDIDSLITEVESGMNAQAGKERELLENANFESLQSGEEMTEAVDDANKLLTRVREIIADQESASV